MPAPHPDAPDSCAPRPDPTCSGTGRRRALPPRRLSPALALLIPALALAACTEAAQIVKAPATPDATAAASPAPVSPAKAAADAERVAADTVTKAPRPRASARTAAQFDTVSKEQKAAATKAPAMAEVRLGRSVASLGDPTEAGLWVKTPLVKTAAPGRVVNPANGKSARVDLKPLGGPVSAGSQISLSAMRLLGISLTDLPEVEIFRN
ncbi:hypothetical protein [Paracoccus jiaweipingae]|uniref:hypothetical protein n=1 Tax=unclassified Paracoccus (in: a-proteobacteria) TaxID=2688777 RepID=UPI0037B66CE9